jgi:hypothetical protein
MSVRESSSAAARERTDAAVEPFTRWPGLLRLSLGVLLGPVVALINQQLIYSVNMWACGRGMHQTMHIVPALCLIVALGAAWTAYSDWNTVGRGVEDEAATIATRTRFTSLLGIAISLFSAVVILAQWAAIFVFDPCMRA